MPVAFEQEFPFGLVKISQHHPGSFEIVINSPNFKPLVQMASTLTPNETSIIFDVKGHCTKPACPHGYTICCAVCAIDECREYCKELERQLLSPSDCDSYDGPDDGDIEDDDDDDGE